MSSDEGEDDIYCICRSSDVNRFMIGCDHCQEWYHGDCINVNEKDAKYIKKYFCTICIEKNPKLEIIYKSKYKEKEIVSNIGSSHSKHKDKESSRSSYEKHREKYDSGGYGYAKPKTVDREKYKEKDRERSKDKDRKHREEGHTNREHRHKHEHGSHHRKHHHRDKEHGTKEKDRKEREKHHRSDNNDRNSEREKRKERDRGIEGSINNESKKAVDKGFPEPNITKTNSFTEVANQSGFKQEDERTLKTETPERLPSSLAIGDTTIKEADIGSDIKKEPEHELKVHYSSESSVKLESQIIEPQCEKIEAKNNILNTRTPSRKDSSDREAMSSPISTAPKNSASRKSVLKELKNIPETDEATAVDIAMRSDDEYGDDSDDRWTERPPKSKKSRLIKESKKRAKSPINKGGGSTSKKRRYIDSTKNRRTMRGMKYYDGNSSDDRNYPQHGGVNDMQELRQCFGHKCLKPTRANSNYCSDECGINLASHRIVQTLPDRLREWNLTECAADIRNKKELEKIRSDQDAVKSRLEQLNIDFRNLEILIERGKLQSIETEKEDEDDGGETEKPSEAEMTVHCVTCGMDIHTRTAIRHMERCYNKFESQTSFASKFKTQIENHRMFCDYYNPKEETYCKRLQVLCPEHNPDPKFLEDEVCGYPIQKEVFSKPSEFCRLSKKRCQPHVFWEKLRRAEIDMERVRQWMKVDELLEQERAVKASMSSRAGVLGLLLHSTFNHELDDRFKAAQQLAEAQRAQLVQAKAKQAAQMMAAKVAAKQQAVANQSGMTLNQNAVVNEGQNQQQIHHTQQQMY